MTAPDTPPARLRPTVSARERGQIEAALGPITDDVALRAVRDGRGRTFQRLEFLGDSVLDVVLSVHRWVEPRCSSCPSADVSSVVSDVHLAEAALRAGLGGWLEWRASDDRIADLVETCAAACWLSGRWPQVAQFTAQTIHPVSDGTLRALISGAQGLASGRPARRVGSALLELAAADGVVRSFPLADEGELSTRRATVHRATAIATVARRRDQNLRGDPELVLSAVEDEVSAALASNGADAALRCAQQFVPVVPR